MAASCGCIQLPSEPAIIAISTPPSAKPAISRVSRTRPDIQATAIATTNMTMIDVAPPMLAAPAVASAIQSPDSTSTACAADVDPRMNIPTSGGRMEQPNAVAPSQNGTPSAIAHTAATAESASHTALGGVIYHSPSQNDCLKPAVPSSILTAHQRMRPHSEIESTLRAASDRFRKFPRDKRLVGGSIA